MKYEPTLQHERVHTLDVIRGLCLLGIIIVNMYGFFLPLPYIELNAWYEGSPFELMWTQNLSIYIQGSIYPLFAMLFGYGVALQYARTSAKGISFYSIAPKRFFILALIGIAHGLLIWWGDILLAYAVCAFILLVFIRWSPVVLLISGLAINGLWQLLLFAGLTLSGGGQKPLSTYVDLAGIEQVVTAYTLGGWGDAFLQRLADYSYQFQPLMWITTILAYMLLGAAAAKWRLIERASQLRLFWGMMAIVFVAVGIYTKSLFVLQDASFLNYYIQSFVGGPLLAIGYAAVISWLCSFATTLKIAQPFANMGRLSMTMYLMQSVVMTLLSYQFGFGLYGKLDVPTMVYLAIGIYVLQVILAQLYLLKWQQGPIEFMWKRLSYRKYL